MGWNATHSCQKELFLPYHWSQRDMKLSLWVVQGPAGYAIPGIPTACGEWVRPAQLQQRLTHFNPGFNWACPSWVYCHFWMRSRPYMHLSLVIHDPATIVTHPWPWSVTMPSLNLPSMTRITMTPSILAYGYFHIMVQLSYVIGPSRTYTVH